MVPASAPQTTRTAIGGSVVSTRRGRFAFGRGGFVALVQAAAVSPSPAPRDEFPHAIAGRKTGAKQAKQHEQDFKHDPTRAFIVPRNI